ncbi:MAG TPA: hypothetical protein VHB77_19640 [Planctomycetaceae bacterium]|nr:hypothetical protein [Planctomycetaceae bacterium]
MSHPLTLEELTTVVAERFRSGPPNGWLLGWDASRCSERLRDAVAPYDLVNCTSFDYSFCNWYEVRFNRHRREAFWTLTAKLSFVAPAYCMHWNTAAPAAPAESQHVESNLRTELERAGFFELPVEWSELAVPNVQLELSGARNVTLSKCLFCDYDG